MSGAAGFDPSAYDLPPDPARDAISDAIDELARRAAKGRANLPPAPSGMYWHESIETDHSPAAWGYRDETFSVRIVWRLAALEATP